MHIGQSEGVPRMQSATLIIRFLPLATRVTGQIQWLFQYRWPLLASMGTAQGVSIIKDGFEATIATQLGSCCCCCSCLSVSKGMF